MNYKLSHIARVTGGILLGSNKVVEHIAIDSRTAGATSSTIFIALRGAGRNGHDFIEDAKNSGISLFMVERLPEDWETLGSFIVVENTLEALQQWAENHRRAFSGEVVAITGSNGKTIVKEWFSQLWDSASGGLFRSPRSYNSQIGVALSLLMIEGDERVAVIEAGVSYPDEMARLQKMIKPTLGVLTNLGDAHSENFGSKEEQLSEKLLLFKGLKPERIIRGDLMPESSIKEHNLAMVEAIYSALDIKKAEGVELLPLSLRLEAQQGLYDSLIFNDSYSNDLVSLRAALDYATRQGLGKPLCLILTDIEQSAMGDEALYSELSNIVDEYNVQKFIGIGDKILEHQAKFNVDDVKFFTSTEDCIEALDAVTFANCAVLIKGARSFRTERISAKLEERTHITTLEISLSKIVDNLKGYEKYCTDGRRIMGMVKASSYGLGALRISKTLLEAGVYSLAVAFADEGIALRRGGITAPIVVLNSDPGSFRTMLENALEPEIYSFSALKNYCREVKKSGLSGVPIHVKLDTGMHRLGFMKEDIKELCELLVAESRTVKVESIFTHLAAADDPQEDDFTRGQIALFNSFSEEIISKIGYRPMLSVANTAGAERFEEARKDLMRIGIGLYSNVSVLRTKITQIKKIAKGETIGYNRRTTADEDMTIAIIPIGYADGLDRGLSRRNGAVAICGELCDIVGNVCMDTAIIDITKVAHRASEGDCVDVLGGDGLSENQIAEKLDTIGYEVLTSISPRIKRLYVW